jgi:hypothetical protein
MDLWTLPLGTPHTTAHHSKKVMSMLAAPHCVKNPCAEPHKQCVLHAHSENMANSIRFAHQSFRSPKISTLLKAIRCRYLKGCPNLTATSVTKYLNPSPATAKGHMKRPQMEICSTQHKDAPEPVVTPTPTNPALCNNQSTNSLISNIQPFSATNANIIDDNDTSTDEIYPVIYPVLPLLGTNKHEFYTMILPEPFTSCPLRATFTSSLYTITKQM